MQMRNVLFLFLLILPFWSFSKVFYFTGSADNDFANPENWTPKYPGANIHEKDSIYIQSDLNINDGSIVLAGRIEILMGVSFYATTWEKFFPPRSGLIFVETKFHPPFFRAKIFDFGNQRGGKEEEGIFLQIYSRSAAKTAQISHKLVLPSYQFSEILKTFAQAIRYKSG
jgi:hypothetical protein